MDENEIYPEHTVPDSPLASFRTQDQTHDTIAAIATPPGRGGIGILRLSGPEALTIATPLLRLSAPLEPNRARFCEIIDPTHADPTTAIKLDEAVVTFYAVPRSYTAEDVVEIAAHGSPILLDFLLRQTLTLGARLAEPGEFTQRAFLAGRLDLTQAEAVRDLIDAQTLYQARVAAQQLDGALSRRIRPIKDALIHLIATLEAGIDFAEDDTPTTTPQQFVTAAEPIAEQLATLAQSFAHGRLVHSGLTLAIVGPPNVGKSSLFNRLVERERAIVTSTPGTTRDLVTERISLAGIPIELIDTAGLRQAAEEAERLGIQKSREALADADLVLFVLDASEVAASKGAAQQTDFSPSSELSQTETETLLQSLAPRQSILVLNKCDLLPSVELNANPNVLTKLHAELKRWTANTPNLSVVQTSAYTGAGLPELRDAIRNQLQAPSTSGQGGMLTNLRQHQAVQAAQAALQSAIAAASYQTPDEMLLLDLYNALHHLDALTGQTTSDDILNLIFSTFCIGK